MTGIVKTDQIQGAQGTTVTVPTGNTLAVTSNATVGGTLGVTGNTTVGGTLGVTGTLTTAAITSTGRHDVNFNGAGTQAFKYTDTGGGNLASFGQFYNTSDGLIANIQNANNDGIHLNIKNGSIVFSNVGYTAANALDDYEEGSWTPSVAGNTTYDNQVGRYVKIGNKVTLWFYIQINQRNSPGVPYIAGGSPFTNSSAITGSGLVHYFEGINNNAVVLTARIDPGGANINISGSTGSAATVANVNHDWVKNGSDIYGFVTHYTG